MNTSKHSFRENVDIRISGMDKEDTFIKSLVFEETERMIKKIEKFWPITSFVLNISKQREEGKKNLYMLNAQLITEKGTFHAEESGWDLVKATGQVLDKIKREVIKEKEKK